MDAKFSPYSYPEVKNIFNKLMDELFEESERGAIIIAVTCVEDHLKSVLEAIFLQNSKKYKKGSMRRLGSFSSKINLCYEYRIIDKNLYDRLHALRVIRNDAAHSSSNFSLHKDYNRVREVYNLGTGIPYYIRKQAAEMMIESKLNSLKEFFNNCQLDKSDEQDIVSSILENKETINNLERQVIYWELVVGLSLICGFISFQKEKFIDAVG